MQEKKHIIGWREWLSLPDLNIPAIKAKIDSGARTSALHAFKLERKKENGKDMAEFLIHPLKESTDLVVKCKSEIIDSRIVKDSGGHSEERFIIMTKAVLKDLEWEIEISLTSRDDMLFRMLLGRTAMVSANISVDPSKSYLYGKELSNYYHEENISKEVL